MAFIIIHIGRNESENLYNIYAYNDLYKHTFHKDRQNV